jgi:hypothetical protein
MTRGEGLRRNSLRLRELWLVLAEPRDPEVAVVLVGPPTRTGERIGICLRVRHELVRLQHLRSLPLALGLQLALDRLLLLFVIRLAHLVVIADHGDIIADPSLTASPNCVFYHFFFSCNSLSINELRARGGALLVTR